MNDESKTKNQLIQELTELRRQVSGIEKSVPKRSKIANMEEVEYQQLLAIFDSIDEAIYVADPDTNEMLYANETLKKRLGDMTGQKCYKYLQNLDSPCSFCSNKHILGEKIGNTHIWEFQNLTNNRWYRCIDRAIKWPDGRMVRCEIAVDIDDQRKVHEAMRESQNMLQMVLDTIPARVFWKDRNSVFLGCNRLVARDAGMDSPDQLIGKTDFDFNFAEQAELYRSDDKQVMDTGKAKLSYEEPQTAPDGSKLWLETSKIPLTDLSDKVIGILGTYQDITARKEAEELLRKAHNDLEIRVQERTAELARANEELRKINELLEKIFSTSYGLIAYIDSNFSFIRVNRAYAEADGQTQEFYVGKNHFDLFPNEENEAIFRRVVETGEPYYAYGKPFEYVEHPERGVTYWDWVLVPAMGSCGKVEGLVMNLVNVTERQKNEEEIIKSQKLESIGLLAGGIAHDFNNVLAIILNDISYVEKYGRLEGRVFNKLKDARNVVVHAKGLTQQLLTFSKGGSPIRTTASISLLLKDSIDFFLSGSNVKCELSIPDNLWPAEVDEGQIGQVINNLIINAEQATPNGGILEVHAENVEMEADKAVPLTEGKYLKISIRDHGVGISRENIQKIFDPYFTTKEGGTGLGLTTTYSIIKKHDGHISVASEIEVGTTFTVYLPASDKELLIEEKAPEKSSGRQKSKILLMEDEERLSKVVRDLLGDCGYEVELARDGSEAIELFNEALDSNHPFDAIVMDLTIPGGMGGKEAIKGLIEIDPDVKAIVTSGYSNDPVMANFKDYGFSGVIPKPYDVEELSEKLTEILSTSDK